VLFALAAVQVNRSYAEAVAVLRLAELHGLRDAKFIATLGGMLFLNRDFDAATKIFDFGHRPHLRFEEQRRVEYRPIALGSPGGPLTLDGRVAETKGNNVWIAVPGYPAIYRYGSYIGPQRLAPRDDVRFAIAFCAIGPIAENLARV
jgi:hypothetical protein